MKRIYFSALLIFFVVTPALAAEAPFAWPESYSVTTTETSKPEPFVNVYNRDGLKISNRNDKFGTTIFRLDEHKKITIGPDGKIKETKLPTDYPISYFFPKDGIWEKLGTDTVMNGQAAIKYKVSNDPKLIPAGTHVTSDTMWLSADNKTPLRFEGDGMVVVSNYSVGPQDPKLFEVPGK